MLWFLKMLLSFENIIKFKLVNVRKGSLTRRGEKNLPCKDAWDLIYFYHVLVIKNLSEKKCIVSLLPSLWRYIICWKVALTFACIYFKPEAKSLLNINLPKKLCDCYSLLERMWGQCSKTTCLMWLEIMMLSENNLTFYVKNWKYILSTQ